MADEMRCEGGVIEGESRYARTWTAEKRVTEAHSRAGATVLQDYRIRREPGVAQQVGFTMIATARDGSSVCAGTVKFMGKDIEFMLNDAGSLAVLPESRSHFSQYAICSGAGDTSRPSSDIAHGYASPLYSCENSPVHYLETRV
nr:hypothetical protein CFP56_13245 [Quercus suber]